MLSPEIIEGYIGKMEELKTPFALYRIASHTTKRTLIVTGPSHLQEGYLKDCVLQPNCNVRDMSVEVFLFESTDQWLLARKMIEVDKVGWKTAAAILYKTPWEKMCAIRHDATAMARLPGFNTKTGKAVIAKICAELPTPELVLNEDAVGALRTMGYKVTDAKNRVRDVLKEHPDYSTEQIIAAALQR